MPLSTLSLETHTIGQSLEIVIRKTLAQLTPESRIEVANALLSFLGEGGKRTPHAQGVNLALEITLSTFLDTLTRDRFNMLDYLARVLEEIRD